RFWPLALFLCFVCCSFSTQRFLPGSYPLSLHDALPILIRDVERGRHRFDQLLESLGIASNVLTDRLSRLVEAGVLHRVRYSERRSEEHTSELQSRVDLVCRLLLDKKQNFLLSYEAQDRL